MPRVLFVCTANRFRSPIAAGLFKKLLTENSIEGDWLVASAGTWTKSGLPPVQEAFQAAERLGISLEGHRTTLLSQEHIEQSDLVLAMERYHQEALRTEFPQAAHRIKLLTEVVEGFVSDIPDPMSTDIDAWTVAAEIETMLRKGFERICQEATKGRKSGYALHS